MGESAAKKMNVIFMAHMHYPAGMAITRRLQNAIDYLVQSGGFDAKVLVLRQGRVRLHDESSSGVHRNVEYVTIGGGIRPGPSALLKGPKYFIDGIAYIRGNYREDRKNVLYVYGYPSTDNLPMLMAARRLGYRIVFDITEDIAYQKDAADLLARLKHGSQRMFLGTLRTFADAVLVVSRHLVERFTAVARDRFEVILYPISVNFGNFAAEPAPFHDPVRFVYSGSFAAKDGVGNLIAAFEDVCGRRPDVNLILTGKGDARQMEDFLGRMAASPHREKMLYKGYLPDEDFYRELNQGDVFCMTRVKSAFANTGFPFKLGEYLATGKPVIASGVSDVNEYLTDRETALLVEPDSVGAIAKAMEYVLGDLARARKIGLAGRAVARKCFDADVLGERLAQLLVRL